MDSIIERHLTNGPQFVLNKRVNMSPWLEQGAARSAELPAEALSVGPGFGTRHPGVAPISCKSEDNRALWIRLFKGILQTGPSRCLISALVMETGDGKSNPRQPWRRLPFSKTLARGKHHDQQ